MGGMLLRFLAFQSNGKIAQELVISEKSLINHINVALGSFFQGEGPLYNNYVTWSIPHLFGRVFP